MKAVALLLLLCIVTLLVQQGDAWGGVRIRVRRWTPRVRRWTRPIRRVVRRVRRYVRRVRRYVRRFKIRRLVRPFRRITLKIRRWRNIARRLRGKFRRLRRTFRRFRRVFRFRFRFRRIKRLVKKIAKPGKAFAKKIFRLAKKTHHLYWMKKLYEKYQQYKQRKEGDEGPDGPPPGWMPYVTPPPNTMNTEPTTAPPKQQGPACPTNGKQGDQSEYASNGDVNKLTPTGAGAMTQAKYALKFSGVDLSKELINKDFETINKKKNIECFFNIAFEHGIQPSLIAAIASRDTRVGKTISRDGYDNKMNYGIIKCNARLSGLGRQCFAYSWKDCNHVNMMIAGVFLPRLQEVRKLKPQWSKHQQLQGAVVAMKYGVEGLKSKSWSNIDSGTTGGDYSNDIIARAQHLIRCYQL